MSKMSLLLQAGKCYSAKPAIASLSKSVNHVHPRAFSIALGDHLAQRNNGALTLTSLTSLSSPRLGGIAPAFPLTLHQQTASFATKTNKEGEAATKKTTAEKSSTEKTKSTLDNASLRNIANLDLSVENKFLLVYLVNYKEKYGNLHIPVGTTKLAKTVKEEHKIPEEMATQVKRVRSQYASRKNQKKLPNSLAILFTNLEELEFTWTNREAIWETYFDKLKEYASANGQNPNPPTQGMLGKWASTLRWRYHRGELDNERIARLEAIGFQWGSTHREKQWDEWYEELVAYRKKEGNMFVKKEENPGLFRWIDRQRQLLRGYAKDRKGSAVGDFEWPSNLKGEEKRRVDLLKKLNFSVAVFDEKWLANFSKLKDYKDKHGHLFIEVSNPENGPLWAWAAKQRHLHKAGQLDKGRVDALEAIGFPWTAMDARWDVYYEELVRFLFKNGTARVPVSQKPLYLWTLSQRKKLEAFEGPEEELDERMLKMKRLLEASHVEAVQYQ